MGTININGQSFNIPSGSVNVKANRDGVTINGMKIHPKGNRWKSPLDIKVSAGIVANIECDGNVQCGYVEGDVDAGGSVQVQGGVGGDIDAGGSVVVKDVIGSVDAGGSVKAGDVHGAVDAGGSVVHR